ncbi:MAG: OsmC family protein [Cyanobacteria bacterium]|nr:OsmC family protein [Cyanobacteriota bacterium]
MAGVSTVHVQSVPGQLYQNTIQIGGHHLTADVPATLGGQDTGPTPMNMLMGALASCTAITLQMYARRKGWDLREIAVDVTEVTQGGQTTFEKEIKVKGQLDPAQIQALETVAEKCPVNKVIKGSTPVQSRINLVV